MPLMPAVCPAESKILWAPARSIFITTAKTRNFGFMARTGRRVYRTAILSGCIRLLNHDIIICIPARLSEALVVVGQQSGPVNMAISEMTYQTRVWWLVIWWRTQAMRKARKVALLSKILPHPKALRDDVQPQCKVTPMSPGMPPGQLTI